MAEIAGSPKERPRVNGVRSASLSMMAWLLAAGCGGGGDDDGGSNPPPPPAGGNHAPNAPSLSVSGAREVGAVSTFEWTVDDADGDALTCRLDVNGDRVYDYDIDPCPASGAQDHTYADGGVHEFLFEVSDGQGAVKLRKDRVSIDGPVFLDLAGNEEYYVTDPFTLRLRVASPVEVAGAQVSVDGNDVDLVEDTTCGECDVAFDGTVRVEGVASGTEVILAMSATDVQGTTSTIYRGRSIDRVPEITITEGPAYSVARPTIDLAASCTDDLDDCTIELCDEPSCNGFDDPRAGGSGSASVTLDLSGVEGDAETLYWRATGSRDQAVTRELIVYVDSSARLEEADVAPGNLFDADAGRLLYGLAGPDPDAFGHEYFAELRLLDRTTREDIELTAELADRKIEAARLTPTGALLVTRDPDGTATTPTTLHEYRDGQLVELSANDAEIADVAGDYALYREDTPESPLRFVLKQFSVGTEDVVCENAQCPESSEAGAAGVAANGVTAWASDGQLYVYDASVLSTPPVDTNLSRSQVRTNGTELIYAITTGDDQLAFHDGVTESVIDALASGTLGPRYEIEDDWVAYQGLSLQGNPQIFLRDALGVTRQQTFFNSESVIETLAPDGTTAFLNDRRYLVDPPGTQTEIGSTLGTSMLIDGEWYVRMGRELFRVVLP